MDSVDRRLTGDDGQGQQVGHDRELGQHGLLTLSDLMRQPPIPAEHPDGDADDRGQTGQHRVGMAVQPREQRRPDATPDQADRAPDQLLHSEVLDRRLLAEATQPPTYRRRTTDQPVQQGDGVVHQRAEQPANNHERRAGRIRSGQQARRHRRVPDVGSDPFAQPDRTHRRRRPYRDEHSGRGQQSEQRPQPRAAHRATAHDNASRRGLIAAPAALRADGRSAASSDTPPRTRRRRRSATGCRRCCCTRSTCSTGCPAEAARATAPPPRAEPR